MAERPVSNRNGSQGEQPPAALARTESPDGLEDMEKMVRVRRLERPRVAPLEPKSSASTNSATPARKPLSDSCWRRRQAASQLRCSCNARAAFRWRQKFYRHGLWKRAGKSCGVGGVARWGLVSPGSGVGFSLERAWRAGVTGGRAVGFYGRFTRTAFTPLHSEIARDITRAHFRLVAGCAFPP